MKNFKKVSFLLVMFFAFTMLNAQSYVQLGNGTASSSMPYTAWNYSWSKAIYGSSQMGSAITIDALAFQVNQFSTAINNQKIYLKHSSTAVITGTYENPETSGYTLVFDGSIVSGGESTGQWIDIEFSTSFDYNGTDNLIVYMTNEHGASMYNNFYATDITGDVIKVSGNDDVFPTADGFSPYPAALPNVRFYYTAEGPGTPSAPIPSENEEYVDAETTLSFDVDATTTSFDVYFSNVEADVVNMDASAKVIDGQVVGSAGTYIVDPTPNDELLNSKTNYFWRVVVSDGASTSSSPVWAFESQKIISNFPYQQDFEGGDDVVFTLMNTPSASDWNWTTGVGSWSRRENVAHSGDSCAYISPAFLDQGVEYELKTPRLNLPENAQISFWWYNGNTRTADVDSTYFQLSTDGGNIWSTLATLAPTEAQNDFQQVLLSLAGFEGNNTYMRWVYKVIDENSSPKYTFLDDIVIQQVTSEPEIALSVNSLNFNEIALGGYNEKSVIITNNNINNDLVITGVALDEGFTCNYSGTIAGGASDTAIIRFSPTAAVAHNGTVTFEIDGAFSGVNALDVNGLGLALQANVFEYFDATPIGQIPAGWSKIESPDDQFHFVKVASGVTGEYNSPTNVLRMYNNDEYTHPLLAILPGVTGFDTNELKFYAMKSTIDSVALLIGVMSNPFDAGTFEVVDTVVVSQQIAQYSVTFDAANTKPYIALRHAQVDEIIASIRIDDVVWKNPNSTELPNAAGNVYPMHGATDVDVMQSAFFEWSNQGGEPTGYRIYLGTDNEADDLINGIDAGDVTNYLSEIDLDFGTEYFWRVVAYNDNGDAANSHTWSFTTMEDPTITQYPYSEDFNNYTLHSPNNGTFRYPLGWSIENNLSKYYCWDKLSNNANSPANAHSDSVAMHLVGFSFIDPMDDWLFTPPMFFEAGSVYEFSFWYKTSEFPGEATAEKLEVLLGSDNSSVSMTSDPLFYDDNITIRDYTQYLVTFQIETTGNYYIGFHGFSDPYQWILHIDDVMVDKVEEYAVTFNITGDGSPLEDAHVNVDGQVVITNSDGQAVVYLENGNYSYEITATSFNTINGTINVNGESQEVNLDLTDINDLQAIGFSIYPNPSNGIFNISGVGGYSISVCSSIGQMLQQIELQGNGYVDLTNYVPGVYYVKVECDDRVATQKLIVE